MPETAVPEVPQTSTPAPSSPSSPAGSPTTQAAPTTTSASERPTEATIRPDATRGELAAFLKQADGAADATTPQSPLVADPAAAPIAPPTEPTVAGAPQSQAVQGPIPFAEHKRILDNARTKAGADKLAELGLPPTFTRENAQWALDVATRINRDGLLGFHKWLSDQIAADPRYRQQLAPQAQAPTKPQPDVEIRDERGNVVGMGYSAAKQEELLAWNQQQLKGEFAQMLHPFQQEREQRLQHEQLAAIQADQERRADTVLAQVNRILRMDTLSKDDQAALGAKLLDEMSRTPNAIEAALIVFEREVVPGLEKRGQQAARDTDLKKAAANTVNGTGGRSAPTLRPDASKEDLIKFLKQQDGVA